MRTLTLPCLLLFVVACSSSGPDNTKKSANDTSEGDKAFAAFLKLKHQEDASEEAKRRLRERYDERAALSEAIADQGLLDKALLDAEVEEFRKQATISRYFDNYLQKHVDDKAVHGYYTDHIAEFEEQKVDAAHVLVRLNPRMSEEERKAKFSKVQEAYAKLKTGMEFSDVAKQYSEDTLSAGKGGALGYLKAGAIDPRFSAALFDTAAGTYTEPFESSFGFHIVKVISGPETVRRPLEAVKGEIRHRLRAEAKASEIRRLLGKEASVDTPADSADVAHTATAEVAK